MYIKCTYIRICFLVFKNIISYSVYTCTLFPMGKTHVVIIKVLKRQVSFSVIINVNEENDLLKVYVCVYVCMCVCVCTCVCVYVYLCSP